MRRVKVREKGMPRKAVGKSRRRRRRRRVLAKAQLGLTPESRARGFLCVLHMLLLQIMRNYVCLVVFALLSNSSLASMLRLVMEISPRLTSKGTIALLT